jgi:hypothetical protein
LISKHAIFVCPNPQQQTRLSGSYDKCRLFDKTVTLTFQLSPKALT